MAQSVLHSAKTSTGNQSVLTITSATAGNLLVVFMAQSASVLAPSISDNINGTTGWTVNATDSTFGTTGTNSVYVAYRIATGGETTLTTTPGAGGTMNGVACFEVTGNAGTIVVDTIVKQDVTDSTSTRTSAAVTTTDSTSIVLAGVGENGDTGTITAWTGTGPMTNIGTTSTRLIGGSYVPGTTLSAVTFTANWTTANRNAMLVIAINGPTTTTSTSSSTSTTTTSTSTTTTSTSTTTTSSSTSSSTSTTTTSSSTSTSTTTTSSSTSTSTTTTSSSTSSSTTTTSTSTSSSTSSTTTSSSTSTSTTTTSSSTSTSTTTTSSSTSSSTTTTSSSTSSSTSTTTTSSSTSSTTTSTSNSTTTSTSTTTTSTSTTTTSSSTSSSTSTSTTIPLELTVQSDEGILPLQVEYVGGN